MNRSEKKRPFGHNQENPIETVLFASCSHGRRTRLRSCECRSCERADHAYSLGTKSWFKDRGTYRFSVLRPPRHRRHARLRSRRHARPHHGYACRWVRSFRARPFRPPASAQVAGQPQSRGVSGDELRRQAMKICLKALLAIIVLIIAGGCSAYARYPATPIPCSYGDYCYDPPPQPYYGKQRHHRRHHSNHHRGHETRTRYVVPSTRYVSPPPATRRPPRRPAHSHAEPHRRPAHPSTHAPPRHPARPKLHVRDEARRRPATPSQSKKREEKKSKRNLRKARPHFHRR